MKTHMIFACAILCTSLGILSMEQDKTDIEKMSPAVNRCKQVSNTTKSKSSLLRYSDYFWHKSRNEFIPEEVIKRLSRENREEAYKHNKLVHCYIDGCSFINDRPVKQVLKKEQTNFIIADIQFPQRPSNPELRLYGNQADCQVVIDMSSGKLIYRESYLNEHSLLKKNELPLDKRCCCILL